MNIKTTKARRGRKVLRIVLFTFLSLVLLVVLGTLALTLPAVQQRLTEKAESFLREKLGTRVEVGSIRVRFPYDVSLENFLLEDENGDTLARVGSLVVDVDMWKLLDRTIAIKEVTLEDASVRLLTRDSVNNFDFIAKAFANPADPNEPTPSDSTASPWKLAISPTGVNLKNVAFRMVDEDAGALTQAQVGTARMVVSQADLDAMRFTVDDLELADADIRLESTRPSESDDESAAFALDLAGADIERTRFYMSSPEMLVDANLAEADLEKLQVQSGPAGLRLGAGRLDLRNSALVYRDPEQKPTPGHFNPGDIDLQNLNGRVTDFASRNDTLSLQADDLSGTDKSGLVLHSLGADLSMTSEAIVIKDAAVDVNQTHVAADATLFRTKDQTFDRLDIQLREARGVVGDLLRAIPPLQDESAVARLRDMPFEASGRIHGSLQAMNAEDFRLRAGDATVVHLTGSVSNLENTRRLGTNLRINRLETTRADLIRWMGVGGTTPAEAAAQPLPAYLRASGSLGGALSNLTVDLQGEAGPLQKGANPPPAVGAPLRFFVAGRMTDVQNPDRLAMDLQLRQVDAPRAFLAAVTPPGMSLPEQTAVTGTLKGSLADLNANLQVRALRGGAQSRLALNGSVKHLRDPGRRGFDLAYDGEVTRQEIYGYVAAEKLDKAINLPSAVQIEGRTSGRPSDLATATTLWLNGLGIVRVNGTLRDSTYDVALEARDLQVGRLAADTALLPVSRVGLRAQLKGTGFQFLKTARFNAAGTLDSVIYGNNILRDITFGADVDGQKFNGQVSSPDERAALRALVSGDLSLPAPLIEADVSLNCLDMKTFGWTQRPTTVCMRIKSRSEGLSLDTLKAKVVLSEMDLRYDTVHVRPGDLTLDASLLNDHNSVVVSSNWLTGELKGFFSIQDLPSTINGIFEQYFVVDRSSYVPPGGTDSIAVRLELLRPWLLTTGLVPGLQRLGRVKLEGSLNAPRNEFDFNASVARFTYQDWSGDSVRARAFAGDTAAMFTLSLPDLRRRGEPFVRDLDINGQFRANRGSVTLRAPDAEGRERYRLALQAQLLPGRGGAAASLLPEQVIDYKVWSVDADNRITLRDGAVEVQDLELQGHGQSILVEGSTRKLAGGGTGLAFDVDVSRVNLDNLDLFLSQSINDLKGWLEADIKVGGTAEALEVRGRLQFHETEVVPKATNVRYKLSETPLEFTAEGVDLTGLELTDPFGEKLTLRGKILTSDWKDIRSDLQVRAEDFQVLSTTRQQNERYYGTVFITLDGEIKGPLSQPEVLVEVENSRRSTKESEFTYVNDKASQTLDHEGIVVFLQPARKYVRPPIYDQVEGSGGMYLSASIDLDTNLTLHAIVDPTTGDAFDGAANGRLQFEQQRNGIINLSGRLELTEGLYHYSYRSVVQREFEVVRGSTLIWSGDPRTPEVVLRARHVFETSPYPLVANQLAGTTESETREYRRSQTFYLQTLISGPVSQPNIDFSFVYPPDERENALNRFNNQDVGLVRTAIGTVNTDPNLLSRQVFGVLLMRNFIGESAGLSLSSGGGDPFREGLNKFLTTQINALADQYLTWIDVDFETKDEVVYSGAEKATSTTTYQLRLQKSFFEDRLTFKLSGGAATGGPAEENEVHTGLENASVEYAVTREGWLKVRVFSEQGFELLNATTPNIRNSGAGVLISKEFGGIKKNQDD
jgi:hypothetical protein